MTDGISTESDTVAWVLAAQSITCEVIRRRGMMDDAIVALYTKVYEAIKAAAS